MFKRHEKNVICLFRSAPFSCHVKYMKKPEQKLFSYVFKIKKSVKTMNCKFEISLLILLKYPMQREEQ